jgi:hypothetical protein
MSTYKTNSLRSTILNNDSNEVHDIKAFVLICDAMPTIPTFQTILTVITGTSAFVGEGISYPLTKKIFLL